MSVEAKNSLVLASASPRRLELLRRAGFTVRVCPAHIDESLLAGETPAEHVERLADRKALVVAERHPRAIVLGADTVVVSPAGEILGKPVDLTDARRMLAALSGCVHRVLTGVCLRTFASGWRDAWVRSTEVRFKTLTPEVVERYLAQVETLDKAGAYAIQERGELLVAATSISPCS